MSARITYPIGEEFIIDVAKRLSLKAEYIDSIYIDVAHDRRFSLGTVTIKEGVTLEQAKIKEIM